MEFEWDERKSERNRIRRELPFGLAPMLFEGNFVASEDDRRDYGERRMQAIGVVGDLIVQCVYTDRNDVRRIISLRRASRKERDVYRALYLRGD